MSRYRSLVLMAALNGAVWPAIAAEAILPGPAQPEVRAIQQDWSRIERVHKLAPADAKFARRMAATWIYLQVCAGNPDRIAEVDRRAATAIVQDADVTTTAGAAIVEMIQAVPGPSQPRRQATPSAAICGFAFESATPD